ncbi:MAG: hypothetical protein AAFY67_14760 [Cyanobacteria bacterium J06642_9]
MAFYILIIKSAEDSSKAIYKFGPNEECLGSLSIDKVTGEVEQIDPVPVERPEGFFVRASTKLRKHLANGQLPDRTSWES